MNKKVIFLFSTLIFISISLFSQRNYGQELVNLLDKGKCFEACNFNKQYDDSMPKNSIEKGFVALYYKYKMASFFNKPDSAVIYLHQLVTDYENILGLGKSHFYSELLGLLVQQQQYDKGITVCDEIIDYMKRNPFKIADSTELKNAIKGTENIKAYFAEIDKTAPRIKLVRNKIQCNKHISLYNDSAYIFFDAEYNGQWVKTWFDTGVSYYFLLEKSLADRIGVKYKPSKDSLQLMNNTNVRALEGVIDSVCLGNIRLYNIPVMVFLNEFGAMIQDSLKNMPEKKAKVDSTFNSARILLGLPTMRLIEQFEFNWKSMTLELPEKYHLKQVKPNIYLEGINVYAQTQINRIDYTSFWDTGWKGFIDIDSTFYERNKDKLKIDTLSDKKPLNYALVTNIYKNIPYEYLAPDNFLTFDNKKVELQPKDVIIYKSRNTGTPNGVFGVYFFKRLGAKTILDFRNMRLEGKGRPIKKKTTNP